MAVADKIVDLKDLKAVYNVLETRTQGVADQLNLVIEEIAPPYIPGNEYHVGDYVSRDRKFYRRIIENAGAPDQNWNPEKWTEVDIVPELAGSISDLKNVLNTTYDIADKMPFFMIPGKYIITNGETVDISRFLDSSTFSVGIMDCSEGDVFIINGHGGNFERAFCCIDDAGNVLSKSGSSVTLSNFFFIAPRNAAKLIVHDNTNSRSYKGWYSTSKMIIDSEILETIPASYGRIDGDIFISTANYRHYLFPIKECTSVFVKANNEWDCIVGILSGPMLTTGETPSFAEKYNGLFYVPFGESVKIDIDNDDEKYLYIYSGGSDSGYTGYRNPELIIFGVNSLATDFINTHRKLEIDTKDYVRPEFFGARGDGQTDDSSAFDEAIAWCLKKNKSLYLNDKTYIAKNIDSEFLCSIIGVGNATVNFGVKGFTYQNNLVLRNVRIVCESAYTKTDSPTAFLRTYNVGITNSVHIENVEYRCVNADDTHRGKTFIRFLCENAYIDKVRILGAHIGFIFNNIDGLNSKQYIINNIYAENTQTLIDVEGYTSSSQVTGRLRNFSISNIVSINSYWNKQNYTSLYGADCLLISHVENLTINNVYCLYPIERALYIVNVFNVSIRNISSYYGEGVKVVGTQKHIVNPQLNDYYISKHITIDNVFVLNATNSKCLVFYEVDNVFCSNITFVNERAYAPDYGIGITGVCSNMYFNGVYGYGAHRGLFHIYADSSRNNDIRNIYISNVLYDLPVATAGYCAIRFYGAVSTYAYNINFTNVHFNVGKDKYNEQSVFGGLIDANYCDGLTIDNCDAFGLGTQGTGINIADTCNHVTIKGDIESSTPMCIPDFKANVVDCTINNNQVGNSTKTTIQMASDLLVIPTEYEIKRKIQVTESTDVVVCDEIGSGIIEIIGDGVYMHGIIYDNEYHPIHAIGEGVEIDTNGVSVSVENPMLLNVMIKKLA